MIFISYRHKDATYVRALQLALESRVGADAVLRDVKSSRLGGDLRDVITDQLERSRTVLVVIGHDWIGFDAQRAQSVSHRDRDWVRFELSLALAWQKELIPILLDNAAMPARAVLPADIAGVTDQIALRLRDADWESDLAQLWLRLGHRPTTESPSSPRPSTFKNVGPIAGRDVNIRGRNVAGRDSRP